MSRSLTIGSVLAILVFLAWSSADSAQKMPGDTAPKTDAQKIVNALSAAPRAVAREAKVVDIDGKGNVRTLRDGKGNFTCLPDNPTTPGNDPMCLDPNGMAWADAWMTHKDPPADKVGFGYMLKGGSDASNTDPYATTPAPGQKWVDTGPHVMIFNVKGKVEGYPTQHGDASKPYVMWPGTPYEHLMIPVGPAARQKRMSGAQPSASPK